MQLNRFRWQIMIPNFHVESSPHTHSLTLCKHTSTTIYNLINHIVCGIPYCRHIVCIIASVLSVPLARSAKLYQTINISDWHSNSIWSGLIKWIVRLTVPSVSFSVGFALRLHIAQSSKVELLNFAKILIKRQWTKWMLALECGTVLEWRWW